MTARHRIDLEGGAPALRVRRANDVPVAADRDVVVYWMIAARRTRWSFALDRALAWARELGRPLLVLEALRAGYPWASDRMHRFVLDGMRDNAGRFARTSAAYYPYVEPSDGAGKGLLAALARRACVIVTDEFPGFFLPRMVEAAARRIDAALEVVDGNGLLPLAAAGRDFTAAAHFRRYVQKQLPAHLADMPRADPLAPWTSGPRYRVPAELAARWPCAPARLLAGDPALLASVRIDHTVPVSPMRGGSRAAPVRAAGGGA